MKILIYFLIFCAFVVIGYNATFLEFDNLLKGDSSTAVIGIVAALCVIVLLWILLVSKKIEEKSR